MINDIFINTSGIGVLYKCFGCILSWLDCCCGAICFIFTIFTIDISIADFPTRNACQIATIKLPSSANTDIDTCSCSKMSAAINLPFRLTLPPINAYFSSVDSEAHEKISNLIINIFNFMSKAVLLTSFSLFSARKEPAWSSPGPLVIRS